MKVYYSAKVKCDICGIVVDQLINEEFGYPTTAMPEGWISLTELNAGLRDKWGNLRISDLCSNCIEKSFKEIWMSVEWG